MSLNQRILEKFVQANGATARANFREGHLVYTFPDGDEMTESELIGSAEFAGFSDGIQRKPNKFEQAPKGTAKRDGKKEDLLDAAYEAAKARGILGKVRKGLSSTTYAPRFGYTPQYELGKSCIL